MTETLGELPEQVSVHLDRGYDSKATRERLQERGLLAEIAQKGKPTPLMATKRWVVERTSSWHNAHKKLSWCTERRKRVIDFWVAFSDVIIIVRRLVRESGTTSAGRVDLLVDRDSLVEALFNAGFAKNRIETRHDILIPYVLNWYPSAVPMVRGVQQPFRIRAMLTQVTL